MRAFRGKVLSFYISLAIPQFGLLSHISSLRLSSEHSGPILTLRTNDAACASLSSPRLLVVDARVRATSPLTVVVRCLICVFFFPPCCCPLRFQNSPQTHIWEGSLLFGNFSFMTPSPGQVSVANSFVCFCLLYFALPTFIFCPTYFQREWAAFLGVWCPPLTFRSCFEEAAQHSDDLLMNLWGRKWSPYLIPLPSWGCPPYLHFIMFTPIDLWR